MTEQLRHIIEQVGTNWKGVLVLYDGNLGTLRVMVCVLECRRVTHRGTRGWVILQGQGQVASGRDVMGTCIEVYCVTSFNYSLYCLYKLIS